MSWLQTTNQRLQAKIDRLISDRRRLFIGVLLVMVCIIIAVWGGLSLRQYSRRAGDATGDDWRDQLPSDTVVQEIAGPADASDTQTQTVWWQYQSDTDGLTAAFPGEIEREEYNVQAIGAGTNLTTVTPEGDIYAVVMQAYDANDPHLQGANFFDFQTDDLNEGETMTKKTVAGHPAAQFDELDPETGRFRRSLTIIMPDRLVAVTAISHDNQPPAGFDYFVANLQITR